MSSTKSSTKYPPAVFERFIVLPGQDVLKRFRRKFACPSVECEAARKANGARGRRRIGRQTVRELMDQMRGFAVSGYAVDRIELARELRQRPDLPDGTPLFGLPSALWHQAPTPGKPAQRPLHHAVPVLPSVGESQRVGRHDPRRVHEGGSYWILALNGERAGQPFVVTCPDCRQRCSIEGALPEEELRHLSSTARQALRS